MTHNSLSPILGPPKSVFYQQLERGFAERGIEIELFFELEVKHHDLTMNGMIPMDLEGFWERCTTLQLQRLDISIISPWDQVLTIVVSCCRKGFNRLRHYSDLARICKHFGQTIKWDEIAERARKSCLVLALYSFVGIARSLSPHLVPQHLMNNLEALANRKSLLDFLIKRQLLARSSVDNMIGCPSNVHRHLLCLRMVRTNRDLVGSG